MEGLGHGASWQTITIALNDPEVLAETPGNYTLHRDSRRDGCGSDGHPLRIPSVTISAFGIMHDETGEKTPSNASS
jgi:hypothetical protein